MPLELTPRRKSMLQEMGIMVWSCPAPAKSSAPSKPPSLSSVSALGKPPTRKPFVQEVVQARIPSDRTPSASAFALHPLPENIAGMDWPKIDAAVMGCQGCGLGQTRSHALLGSGDRQADIFILCDHPSEAEDLEGSALAGPTGRLLDSMLKSLRLEQRRFHRQGESGGVYVSHAIKCHPGSHAAPPVELLQHCAAYWQRQIALVQPKVILSMGRLAAQALLSNSAPVGQLRGHIHRYMDIPVVVSHHPDYYLRNKPLEKANAWEDLCLVRQILAESALVN